MPLRGSFKSYSNYCSTKKRGFGFDSGDRDRKKRDFCRLWITWINALIHKKGLYSSSSYSKFINDLRKRQSLLNRKILVQIAILNRNRLYMI